MMLRRALLFSAVFSAGLALSVSTLAGAPSRFARGGPDVMSFQMADMGYREPRAARPRGSRGAARASRRQDPLVIPGIYRRDTAATHAPKREVAAAPSRRRQARGFREVPKAPSLLVVPGQPLPFQPGCTENSNSDHLGQGWFKVVVKKTCFVR
jgi:hypothetical protein